MGSYTIRFDRQVKKDFRSIPVQDIRRIKSAIQNLSNNPRPDGCTKLKGSNDYYRIRVGNYRIVDSIEDKILSILVVRVGHRRDIYR